MCCLFVQWLHDRGDTYTDINVRTSRFAVVPGSRGQLGMLFTNVDKELIKQLRMPICICSFFGGNVYASVIPPLPYPH